MKISVYDSYEALSVQACRDLFESVQTIQQPLVCTASGDSPAGLYREMVQKVKNKKRDLSNWYFVGLDEWYGMNENDEGSCRFHLNNQLFGPLNIDAQRIYFFDGRTSNTQKECNRVESFIQEHGGIDVAILGLGMNGHIGMNEPGTPPDSRSHLAEIDAQTQQVGQKYFKHQQDLSKGLTLGMTTIMEAKQIMLIVSGAQKASIVQKLLKGDISPSVPASFLRMHPKTTIYLDQASAQLISLL